MSYPRPYANLYRYPGVAPDVMGSYEITCVAFASFDDNDAITIIGPLGTKTFEFDFANDGVSNAAFVEVNILAGDTADQVRDKLVAAINSAAAAIGVHAVATTAGKLQVNPGGPGTFSISENVTNAGFTLTGSASVVGDQVQPGILGEAPCAFRATGTAAAR